MIRSNQFTHDAKSKMFVIELSILERSIRQIYPDACDDGFTMVSDRTGSEVDFVESDRVMRDEELEAIVFEPTAKSLRKFPSLTGYTVHAIND